MFAFIRAKCTTSVSSYHHEYTSKRGMFVRDGVPG
mgnify:CR=1 FL=1|jgi:hypothetical protein